MRPYGTTGGLFGPGDENVTNRVWLPNAQSLPVEKGDVEGFVLTGTFCSTASHLFFNARGHDCTSLEGFPGYLNRLNTRHNPLNRTCGSTTEGFWKLAMHGYALWMKQGIFCYFHCIVNQKLSGKYSPLRKLTWNKDLWVSKWRPASESRWHSEPCVQ